ncbi:MAG: class I SAM-dependent methyltransferase [Thermoplasmata archaeon]
MQPESNPDVSWVAALANVSEARAQRSVEEAQGEQALYRHLDRMHRMGGRPSYVEIDAPLELYALVRLLRPRHVVEVGVSSGVSSAYMLQALEGVGRGTLHSVDLPKLETPKLARGRHRYPSWALPPGRSSGWAVPLPLRGRWDLRLGDKKRVLPLLAEENFPMGLFVYDVPHDESKASREFAQVDRRFHRGSVAIADHGPGGGLCAPLRRWARSRGALPVRCGDLGLFGFRSAR